MISVNPLIHILVNRGSSFLRPDLPLVSGLFPSLCIHCSFSCHSLQIKAADTSVQRCHCHTMPSTAIPPNLALLPQPQESRHPVQCQKEERWPEHDTLRPLGMLLGPPASWCACKSTQTARKCHKALFTLLNIKAAKCFMVGEKSYRVQSIIPLYVSSPSPFCKVCRRVFMTVQASNTHVLHQLKGVRQLKQTAATAYTQCHGNTSREVINWLTHRITVLCLKSLTIYCIALCVYCPPCYTSVQVLSTLLFIDLNKSKS